MVKMKPTQLQTAPGKDRGSHCRSITSAHAEAAIHAAHGSATATDWTLELEAEDSPFSCFK